MNRLAILMLLCLQAASALQVGYYSLTFFNMTTARSNESVDFLARVFEKYDVVGFNMVSDPDAIFVLLDALQERNQNYRAKVSPLLSQHDFQFVPSFQESFGFFYRSHIVSLGQMIIDRPTSAISSKVTVLKTGQEFVFSLVHLIAGDVFNQLELLPAVYERLMEDFNCKNVVFSGDFNTASRYISEDDYHTATVSQDPTFQWYIDFDDVTIENPITTGAVNRFLVAGDIKEWVVPGSAKVIDTTKYYGLTEEQKWTTSVFYPIEFELYELRCQTSCEESEQSS